MSKPWILWELAGSPLLSEDGNEIITEGQNLQKIVVKTLIGMASTFEFPNAWVS